MPSSSLAPNPSIPESSLEVIALLRDAAAVDAGADESRAAFDADDGGVGAQLPPVLFASAAPPSSSRALNPSLPTFVPPAEEARCIIPRRNGVLDLEGSPVAPEAGAFRPPSRGVFGSPPPAPPAEEEGGAEGPSCCVAVDEASPPAAPSSQSCIPRRRL